MDLEEKRSWKLQEFTAHGANVNCLALGQKSGRVLATGGDDKLVNLWATGKQNCIMSLSGHESPVECVKFRFTEDIVSAGSQSGILKIWDLEAAKLVRTSTGHRYGIKCIDFHPYDDYLVSGSLDTNIKLWDIRRRGCVFTYKGNEGAVNSIKFSPDGHWIASGDEYGNLIIWDLRVGRPLKELTKHNGAVTDVEFHPRDFLLASSGSDRCVRIWDLENFQLVSAAERESSSVRCLRFSLGGECLFGGRDEQMSVYGWEPTEIYDTATIGWGKVQDTAVTQNRLFGASFYLSSVLICVVDLTKVAPFGSPLSSKNKPIGVSFIRDNATRKSFNKQKSVNESVLKVDIKPTIDESETEHEEETSMFIPDVNDYKAVFRPQRSLNRSPPLLIYSSSSSNTQTQSLPVQSSICLQSPPKSFNEIPKINSPIREKTYSSLPVSSSGSSSTLLLNQVNITRSIVSSAGTTLNNNQNSSTSTINNNKNSSASASILKVSIPQSVSRSTSPVSENKLRITNSSKKSDEIGLSPPVTPNTSIQPVSICSSMDSISSTQSSDCEVIPNPISTSNVPNGLNMDDFLPVNYKRTGNRNLIRETPEAEALEELNRGHAAMVAVLKTRKKSLEVIYALWRRKDFKCAMDEAISMNDLSIIVDILGVINSKPGLWNLDICGMLLPVISNLLQSKFEVYMGIGCDSLRLIMRNFSSVIKSNILCSSSAIGVDVSKEERYNKCMNCYRSLVSIRAFLLKRQTMQGKLGQSFRELHTMLQEIDVS